MAAKPQAYAHQKRIQRHAHLALAAATALALWQILAGDASLRSIEIPILALLGIAVAGAALAAFAIAKRSTPLSLAGASLLVLAVVPGGAARPSVLDYALGALFGLVLLLAVELVHMTERYARAHRAVEKENVPEEHINRVTDEAVKTLATRAGLAGIAVAGAVGLAYLLALVGPRQWRAAAETTAPVGVAIAALAIAGAASMFVLARGAALRDPRPNQEKEVLPDVAE